MVLTRGAVVDGPTLIIAVVALVLLWRFKLSEPIIVLLAGEAGLLLH